MTTLSLDEYRIAYRLSFYIKGINNTYGKHSVARNYEVDKIQKFHYENRYLLHSETEPALEISNGEKYWFKHGLLHRIDGPAMELSKIWYYEGDRIDVPCQEEFERYLKLKSFWQ